jgi:outer membrane cobalamin receptor
VLALTLLLSIQLTPFSGISGIVTDSAGAPVVRARVRVVEAAGAERASTFTDGAGRFRFVAIACDGCRVEASLVGFETASATFDPDREMRLALAVAPVHETVVVSATRDEAPSGQVGAAVTVFTADDFARRANPPVAELLRAAPGVTVVRSGGLGNVASLFVRGGESNYNKVLLDGIPLNEPGGTFNFSHVTTEHLERIEVVRGAHSALFGSDAMASVVQLFTARGARSRPRGFVTLEAGSLDGRRGSLGFSGGTGVLDYAVHAARQHTDNRVPNNAFDNTTLSINVGVGLSSRASLRFIGRGELGKAGTPGATAFGRPDMDAFFRRRDGVGGLTLSHQTTASWKQRMTYALAASHQASTNLAVDPPFTPRFGNRSAPFEFFDFRFDSRTDLRRHHASYQSDWRLPGGAGFGAHLLTVVFDWDGERGVLGNRLAGTTTRAARDNFGWAVQHQALGSRASLTSGLRVERNESFGVAVVPRVSAVYLAGRRSNGPGATKLKANVGLGIKEPTLLQSFSPSLSFLGNPDLEPERSRSVDAGVEQRLLGQRAKIELVWFHNRFDHLISTRTLGFNPFRSQFFNVGRTRARGVELVIDTAPVEGMRARGGYTLLDSRVVRSTAPDNPVFRKGQWLFRRPRHSGFVHLSWTRGRATVDAHATFVGRRVDSDFSALAPPLTSNGGYATWDLNGSCRLASRVRGYVAIENVTNADYMDTLGYPSLKRVVRAGARLTF